MQGHSREGQLRSSIGIGMRTKSVFTLIPTDLIADPALPIMRTTRNANVGYCRVTVFFLLPGAEEQCKEEEGRRVSQ
jgi:hypothetical protein